MSLIVYTPGRHDSRTYCSFQVPLRNGRLIVGGPSVTDPIDRSKGFQIALVSYHENLAALIQYQASQEYHWITSTFMFPYKEDLVRFDFEVDPEDEEMYQFLPLATR
ncbi:hypothetical protein TMatcc_006619 [Talaromyces marneffei ATCC 18224]|uniref:uncharacterized protein n=1 Tax=Talaromyces marneffei TaxID=37727 RepID=UPI0012AA9A69|nr:uncharacterized protein EYB26_002448 [Talaromyces marneffei]KAE8553895.1 hypothetical protein EYB25_002433 [Talaromyces marneffei]QGA14792.1 hypothetical protein EYB26_002448 [Talaromyces marneffei]